MINTLVIERVFNASVEKVWRAWTEPEQLKKWHGPKNFTCPFYETDFRVGGKYLACMRSAEGQDFWSTGIYQEIVPLKKIVCTDSFANEKGNVIPASELGFPGLEDHPLELLVTVTFEDLGGKTKMIINHRGMPKNMDEMAGAGWNESLDKLAEIVQ